MRGGRLMMRIHLYRRLTETAYKSIQNPPIPPDLASFVFSSSQLMSAAFGNIEMLRLCEENSRVHRASPGVLLVSSLFWTISSKSGSPLKGSTYCSVSYMWHLDPV